MKKLTKKEIINKLVPLRYCNECLMMATTKNDIICYHSTLEYLIKIIIKNKRRLDKILTPDWCPIKK